MKRFGSLGGRLDRRSPWRQASTYCSSKTVAEVGLDIRYPVAIGVLVGVVALGVAAALAWWIPNQRLGDLDFMTQASDSELRDTAHQVLRYPWGNDHDACLVLLRVGNKSSIPYLQKAVRRRQSGSASMECTAAHCREALRRVVMGTGKPPP